MSKKTKLNYQEFSEQFMSGDTFKKITVDNKLIDFPYDKADNKFDYIKEVIKYKSSIYKMAVFFYAICIALLSFSTGIFIWSWWNLLISLFITSLPFGILYKYVNLAAQHQSLVEKAKPFVDSAYEEYLKE